MTSLKKGARRLGLPLASACFLLQAACGVEPTGAGLVDEQPSVSGDTIAALSPAAGLSGEGDGRGQRASQASERWTHGSVAARDRWANDRGKLSAGGFGASAAFADELVALAEEEGIVVPFAGSLLVAHPHRGSAATSGRGRTFAASDAPASEVGDSAVRSGDPDGIPAKEAKGGGAQSGDPDGIPASGDPDGIPASTGSDDTSATSSGPGGDGDAGASTTTSSSLRLHYRVDEDGVVWYLCVDDDGASTPSDLPDSLLHLVVHAAASND